MTHTTHAYGGENEVRLHRVRLRGQGGQQRGDQTLLLVRLHSVRGDDQPVVPLLLQEHALLRAQQHAALHALVQLDQTQCPLQLHASVHHVAERQRADHLAAKERGEVPPLWLVLALHAREEDAQLHRDVEHALLLHHAITDAQQRVHGVLEMEGEGRAHAVVDDDENELRAAEIGKMIRIARGRSEGEQIARIVRGDRANQLAKPGVEERGECGGAQRASAP